MCCFEAVNCVAMNWDEGEEWSVARWVEAERLGGEL